MPDRVFFLQGFRQAAYDKSRSAQRCFGKQLRGDFMVLAKAPYFIPQNPMQLNVQRRKGQTEAG